MSLRARVVALIGAVLLLSVLMGTLVAGYETRQALNAELVAGLIGARQTVRSAFEDLPNSDHPQRDLRQLIDTFNGNRHVRAVLLADDGKIERASTSPTTERPAPRWFARLLGPAPEPGLVAAPDTVPGFRAIALQPVADLDVAVAWRQFSGTVLVLAGMTAMGLALVYAVIGAAFRPLTTLATQFDRIGMGDYSGRVEESGPAELLSLKRGFNRMASELAASTGRNRLLTDQLLTIQDEERADIARDLHDEFGPHLFAVSMDAEMIVQLCGPGQEAVASQARSIQGGVAHMQRQVRDLLGRLRPTRVTELGLNAAVVDLVRFWRGRRPDIAFDLSPLEDESALGEATKEVVYRVVQEAMNNAVRHGDPGAVRISLWIDAANHLHVSISDDGASNDEAIKQGGLGLVGMRERLAATAGTLSFGRRGEAPGWITAALIDLNAAGISAT